MSLKQKAKEPSLPKEASPRKVRLQSVTITNPNNPIKQAVLNIYFLGDDIVLGGIGWFEYFDYEKIQKKKEKARVILESVET